MVDSEKRALARAIAAELAQMRPRVSRRAYTLADLAEATGLPVSSLQNVVSRGEIPAVKRCGKWLVRAEDVERWLRG